MKINKARKLIKALADNSYCQYVFQIEKNECLGKEIKMKLGKFGKKELNAHQKASELIGKHRAYMHIFNMTDEEKT